MKNKFTGLIVILILLPLLIGCSKNESEQEYSKNEAEQEYIHEVGVLTKYDMETFRLYFDNKHTTPVEMIGWSKDGLFACRYKSFNASIVRRYTDLESPPSEYIAESPARYSFVIIDTVANEIIEQDSIVIGDNFIGIVGEYGVSALYDEKERPDRKGYTANLNEIIAGYKIKWEGLLKKHNIIGRVDDFLANNFKDSLLNFPIKNYSCWFDYDKDKNPSDLFEIFERGSIIKWKLMIGNDVVQKIIGEYDETTRRWHIIGSKILGYYKNPYKNSIVVVVSYYRNDNTFEFNTLRGTLKFFACNIGDIKLAQY